jgi:TolA-binding protein
VKYPLILSMFVSALLWTLLARPAWPSVETARAWELLQEGKRGQANAVAVRAFSKAQNRKDKGEALLVRALSTPDGEGAMTLLERFLNEYGGHPLEWRAEMELGLHNYALGSYGQASKRFRRAVGLKGPQREQLKARYWLGLSLMGSGSFAQARGELGVVKSGGAAAGLSDAASLAIADCFREEGSYSQALSEYSRIINEFRKSDWLPAALYGAGLCLEKLNRKDEAGQAFSRLAKEFPSSFEAGVAAGKLKSAVAAVPPRAAEGGFTVQVGAFSQKANADKLVAFLKGKGITDPRVVNEERGGRTLFIVYLGEFPTKEAAREKSKELSARLGLSCSVVAL